MLTLKTTAEYNHWFSNQSLKEQGQIKKRLKNIKINSHFGIVRKINKNLAELRWKNGRRVYFTKGIKISKKTILFDEDPLDFFRNTKKVKRALYQALSDGDKEAFYDILSGFLTVVNKEEFSRKSKIPITTIRRIASGSNFQINTMLKIMPFIKSS